MQTGETRMGFLGGQSRASPLEVHQQQQQQQRQQLQSLSGGAAEPHTTAADNGLPTTTCHQLLPSSYDNTDNSQQLIYSADQQQQVGAPINNTQHVTSQAGRDGHGRNHNEPQHGKHHSGPGRAAHTHRSQHSHHHHQHQHHTSPNESYLHLHQGTNHAHHHSHHSNLVRKHKHQTHNHNHNHHHQNLQHTSASGSASGASKAKQQIAEYALQQAKVAATAANQQQEQQQQQQSLLATTSPEPVSCPLPTHEDGATLSPGSISMQYVSQSRIRVNSISAAPRRQVTPASYSPTPRTPHGRSLSFSAASAGEALLAARQLQPTSGSEVCYFSGSGGDSSASYQTNLATAALGHVPYATSQCQTPSLLSSSACSSIGSPARPASILNNNNNNTSPAPVVHPALGASSSLIQMFSNGHQHQQQHHQYTGPPVYQQPHQQVGHHHSCGGGGGGNSSAPSGGSSTISTSDSLNMSINLEQYISKRNERERSRVRNVNDAFDHLKNSLPLETEKMSKRMSKVEILRTAIGYIRDLEHILGSANDHHAQRSAGARELPPGGQRSNNRPRPFGTNGGERADHPTASAKTVRHEFGNSGLGGQPLVTGENRSQNFEISATAAAELHSQQPRQPFQPDLNHNNHGHPNLSYSFHIFPGAKGHGDCRQDQEQQQQEQEQMMMSYEEY